MTNPQHKPADPATQQNKTRNSEKNTSKHQEELQELKEKYDRLETMIILDSKDIEKETETFQNHMEEVRKLDDTISALKKQITTLAEGTEISGMDITVLLKIFETANDRRYSTVTALASLQMSIEQDKAGLFKTEMELFAIEQQISCLEAEVYTS